MCLQSMGETDLVSSENVTDRHQSGLSAVLKHDTAACQWVLKVMRLLAEP